MMSFKLKADLVEIDKINKWWINMKIPQKIVEQILTVIPKENHVFLAMIFTTAGERNS